MFFGGNGTAVANFFCTGKSLGAGLGENSVPKKSQNKFGTEKKSRNRYRKNLVPEKVSELKPLFSSPKFRNL